MSVLPKDGNETVLEPVSYGLSERMGGGHSDGSRQAGLRSAGTLF